MEMTAVMGREERQKLFPSLPTLPWKARKNRELPTFPQLRRRLGVSFFSQARLTSTSTKKCYLHAQYLLLPTCPITHSLALVYLFAKRR